MYVWQKFVKEARGNMTKNPNDAILSTLQDLLIFQMATAGVKQSEIREAVGVDNNRVSRIARLAKKDRKNEE